MSRDGGGVYRLPAGYLATDGQTANASQHNGPLEDLETDMNTARPIVAGGTGATSASAARTALGLAIGTDVQAYNARLQSMSNVVLAADEIYMATSGSAGTAVSLTGAGRSLIGDADASAQRTTLGLGSAAVADLLDEDDMASDDATAAPSQQSVKAYVDASGGISRGSTTSLSGTAVDWTSIPASVQRLVLNIDGASLDGTAQLLVQLGDATTGGFVGGTSYTTTLVTVQNASAVSVVSSSTAGAIVGGSIGASATQSIRVTVERVDANDYLITAIGRNSTPQGLVCTATVTLAGDVDRIRLTSVAGTASFDAGQAQPSWEIGS